MEAQALAQKEAEKAQADAERLNKSKTSSKYQKEKADHDLMIAQAKAELTDITVALHADLDSLVVSQLTARQDELKQYIAAVNVSKAQLRADLETKQLTGV